MKLPPILNNGKKWTIGCMQGGELRRYNSSLKNFINQLAKLGWLEPVDWQKLPANAGDREIWNFLSQNMRSKYLRIEPKYFWSADWNQDKRKILFKQILSTLQNKEVDLMLAMGTWAGHDLSNSLHSTPTIYMGSSFPIERNCEIPEHIYMIKNHNFLLRQIRLFKKITKFKTLGVVYVNNSEGRFQGNLKILEQFSKDENFKLVAIGIPPHKDLTSAENTNYHIRAHEEISSQIDAMWLTNGFINNPKTAMRVLAPLFKHKIPTWYPHGEYGVANGAVFGIISNPQKRAQYYANMATQIFNGIKPTSLIKNLPIDSYLVINCAAAKKVDFKISKSLLGVAKKLYYNIATGDN